VTPHEGDAENSVEQECVRDEAQRRRLGAEDEVVEISGDEESEDIDDPNEERPCLRYVAVVVNVLAKCVVKPWDSWKEAKIMPREEDVHRMILTGETPDKFSRIDIESRKYFPIAFCILISSYWVAYMYYITDEFPVKEF
jgi:hypothetical protein